MKKMSKATSKKTKGGQMVAVPMEGGRVNYSNIIKKLTETESILGTIKRELSNGMGPEWTRRHQSELEWQKMMKEITKSKKR